MRYFAELSYKGTNYNGWQRQRNAPSVQQTLEEALSTFLRYHVPVTGAGRTDTGVHAAYYVAHFDLREAIADPEIFIRKINSILPYDIALHSVREVGAEAHARFDARQREYKYYISPAKNPFIKDTAWIYYGGLDYKAMNRACEYLLEAEDFTTFSKLHSNNKTNTCDVTEALWEHHDGMSVFTIRSDRFLRNMVRAVVGTLVDVGRDKITPGRFGEILDARDRSLSSGSAPAQGLFLTDVIYPEAVFKKTYYPGL